MAQELAVMSVMSAKAVLECVNVCEGSRNARGPRSCLSRDL